jgi:hypothetical protein
MTQIGPPGFVESCHCLINAVPLLILVIDWAVRGPIRRLSDWNSVRHFRRDLMSTAVARNSSERMPEWMSVPRDRTSFSISYAHSKATQIRSIDLSYRSLICRLGEQVFSGIPFYSSLAVLSEEGALHV